MRALQFSGDSVAEVTEIDNAPLEPGWARVKVHYNSVCGSDLALYQGNWHGNRYPIVPGHEWSGVVSEVNGTGQEWIGRPVIGDLIHACHFCDPCRDGLSVMCESLTEIGFTVNGGCAEYVDVPVPNLYALPDRLPLASACQVEPLAVALHAVDRAAVRPGERVAVLGCGGIGLLIVQAARCAGAVVQLAADPVEFRQKAALRVGAAEACDASSAAYGQLAGERFDVVFEASGAPESVAQGLDMLRPGGRLVAVGYRVGASHPIETAKLPLAYASLLGVMGPGGKYREAISLLASGAVDAAPLLTDFVTLDDHEEALSRAIARQDGTIRVVFDLTGGDRG
ncbi:zinc-binding dehydrogenase [Kitasatospora aureofaciens]|uniref:zinc-binding dehydrogenase n=1 Tax=Kitasatospora aureofaciens TaxID=1894 RepID=UPI0037C9BAC0